MKFTPPRYPTISEMAAIDVGRLTEDEVRDQFERIRWPLGTTCPNCGSKNVTKLSANATSHQTSTRDGVIQCNECRKQFTVTIGTIMERSHITLRQWIQAFYTFCEHKKGISALQLQKKLGLGSYRSAWFMLQRIRNAMGNDTMFNLLKGDNEIDETYIGGSVRKENKPVTTETYNENLQFEFPHEDNHEKTEEKKNKRGRGAKKNIVGVIVSRDGGVAVAKPLENVSAKSLHLFIKKHVDPTSTIITDEWTGYNGIGKDFDGGHLTVNHGSGEYTRGKAYTNNAESFFATMKRGIFGTYHHLSKKYLPLYCYEFGFRWSHRKMKPGEVTEHAIRLMLDRKITMRVLRSCG